MCVCVCVSLCTLVSLRVCEFECVPTHLVCIESFDLGGNGIKIPTDIVWKKTGCKDTESDRERRKDIARETERQSASERWKREGERGHWGMCQLFDLCGEGDE